MLCKTKAEVIAALPIIREALAIADVATIDCTKNSLTLEIKVDMNKILEIIEKQKE
jgi:hypothetical protein